MTTISSPLWQPEAMGNIGLYFAGDYRHFFHNGCIYAFKVMSDGCQYLHEAVEQIDGYGEEVSLAFRNLLRRKGWGDALDEYLGSKVLADDSFFVHRSHLCKASAPRLLVAGLDKKCVPVTDTSNRTYFILESEFEQDYIKVKIL